MRFGEQTRAATVDDPVVWAQPKIRWCPRATASTLSLAGGTRCVAGPGRCGSRPVSGHALHELSVRGAAARPTPVATLVTGGREAAGGAAHLSGREAAADTTMAADASLTTAGHQLSGWRSFRNHRTVNPTDRPVVTTFSTLPQGRPRPAALIPVGGLLLHCDRPADYR